MTPSFPHFRLLVQCLGPAFAPPGPSGYGSRRFGPGVRVSDIFQEVDEDLRHDKWLKLWKQYQNYIIGLAALVVLVTAGITYWRHYDQQQREAEGLRYALALDDARAAKPADAAAALSSLPRRAHPRRATLSRSAA